MNRRKAEGKTLCRKFIEIKNATVYRGQTCVFENFSLDLTEGQNTVILGPNGAGKSTLLKLLSPRPLSCRPSRELCAFIWAGALGCVGAALPLWPRIPRFAAAVCRECPRAEYLFYPASIRASISPGTTLLVTTIRRARKKSWTPSGSAPCKRKPIRPCLRVSSGAFSWDGR